MNILRLAVIGLALTLAMLAQFCRGAEYKLGWKSDPKGAYHAYYHTTRGFGKVKLLPRSDLSTKMPPILNQGGLGSCTAFATHAAFSVGYKLTYGVAADLSELGLYYDERKKDGTINSDAGSYLATGAWVLTNIGSGTEKTWPYREAYFQMAPSAEYYAEAAKFMAVKPYKIDSSTSAARHKGIVTALSSGLPVSFGGYVYPDIFTLEAVHYHLPMPSGKMAGGHAMCIIGHDDTHSYNGIRGWYILRNSWGTKWGREGYCWAPYAYIDSLKYCDDFWVFPNAKK